MSVSKIDTTGIFFDNLLGHFHGSFAIERSIQGEVS